MTGKSDADGNRNDRPDQTDGSDQTGSNLQSGHSLASIWTRFEDQLRRRARTRLRQYGLAGQAESMDICNDVMADLTRRFRDQDITSDDVLAYILKAIDNQVLDTFRMLARQCRDFRRNENVPVERDASRENAINP